MADLFDPEAQRRRFSQRHDPPSHAPTLPTPGAVRAAEASLPDPLSASYLASHPQEDVARHILADLVPAMSGQAASPNYYGFVTGGVLPVAEWADNVVSRMDQNVQVHLPAQSIATKVEAAALEMLVRLLRLEQHDNNSSDNSSDGDGNGGAWAGRTFTTGATASNILGLACGREALLARRRGGRSVAEAGILAACRDAGVREIRVLSSAPHSSLLKAASAVGLGRASVVEVARRGAARPWKLDLDAVERELRRDGVASIVAVSAGEVNTGRYALDDVHEWERLRRMADEHGAWIHLDGAFGIFSRVLDERDEYQLLHVRSQGFHLADSIALDGHKLLNVPYDCGVFLTRSPSMLQSVFQNPNAAYLAPSGPSDAVPSPLHVGIENSRRFRALPVYAALLSEGRAGFARLVHNMVQLSRSLAAFLRDSPHYELLPNDDDDDPANPADADAGLREIFMIVLFRARDRRLNDVLVERINGTREVYVSGTAWAGGRAVRIAVSSWRVDVERDAALVTSTLARIAAEHEAALLE
ncbi:hypothetical protein ESCO_006298 [Escovopsis weberi]|uniref:L-2,4-diaminobutyrate decarboxylase n=1 Tax=Escovopsis weberi TaxID=150374 RepID=A0A0M8MZL5_ESCWE|nr:hypothetical protein ESCO_006298 [Escovopsis weberi]